LEKFCYSTSTIAGVVNSQLSLTDIGNCDHCFSQESDKIQQFKMSYGT